MLRKTVLPLKSEKGAGFPLRSSGAPVVFRRPVKPRALQRTTLPGTEEREVDGPEEDEDKGDDQPASISPGLGLSIAVSSCGVASGEWRVKEEESRGWKLLSCICSPLTTAEASDATRHFQSSPRVSATGASRFSTGAKSSVKMMPRERFSKTVFSSSGP